MFEEYGAPLRLYPRVFRAACAAHFEDMAKTVDPMPSTRHDAGRADVSHGTATAWSAASIPWNSTLGFNCLQGPRRDRKRIYDRRRQAVQMSAIIQTHVMAQAVHAAGLRRALNPPRQWLWPVVGWRSATHPDIAKIHFNPTSHHDRARDRAARRRPSSAYAGTWRQGRNPLRMRPSRRRSRSRCGGFSSQCRGLPRRHASPRAGRLLDEALVRLKDHHRDPEGRLAAKIPKVEIDPW